MLHDLTINMTEEGRRRLWQYSKSRVGTQLLLIADGIAIAAPRIQHELAQGNLTITQMRDEVLLRDATDMLNKKSERTVSK
jgi:preprotein translocase subunit SecD